MYFIFSEIRWCLAAPYQNSIWPLGGKHDIPKKKQRHGLLCEYNKLTRACMYIFAKYYPRHYVIYTIRVVWTPLINDNIINRATVVIPHDYYNINY